MNKLCVAVVLVVCFTGVLAVDRNTGRWKQFHEWATSHGKTYTRAELLFRFKNFVGNAEFVEKFNAEGGHTYTVGLNEYADLSDEEWASRMQTPRTFSEERFQYVTGNTELPAVDWREKNAVSEVKNQLNCGACWAFSATGAIEGARAVATGDLISLSEQQLMDCSRDYNNSACRGGLPVQAFAYLIDAGGLMTEEAYPYKALRTELEPCAAVPSQYITGIKSFVELPMGHEKDLQNAIATIAPISVGIDASQKSFHNYVSGVYYEPACKKFQLDHGVLAVGMGYDSESGMSYYIVKNSWGPTWGQEGYIWMAANMNNSCGIATSASYPTGAFAVTN